MRRRRFNPSQRRLRNFAWEASRKLKRRVVALRERAGLSSDLRTRVCNKNRKLTPRRAYSISSSTSRVSTRETPALEMRVSAALGNYSTFRYRPRGHAPPKEPYPRAQLEPGILPASFPLDRLSLIFPSEFNRNPFFFLFHKKFSARFIGVSFYSDCSAKKSAHSRKISPFFPQKRRPPTPPRYPRPNARP